MSAATINSNIATANYQKITITHKLFIFLYFFKAHFVHFFSNLANIVKYLNSNIINAILDLQTLQISGKINCELNQEVYAANYSYFYSITAAQYILLVPFKRLQFCLVNINSNMLSWLDKLGRSADLCQWRHTRS